MFLSLAFRECKKDCNILKVIRVPGFESITEKLKSLDFSSDFNFLIATTAIFQY